MALDFSELVLKHHPEVRLHLLVIFAFGLDYSLLIFVCFCFCFVFQMKGVLMFEEEGGLDALEALQYSDNNELFERASQLIREFYVSSYLLTLCSFSFSLSLSLTTVLHDGSSATTSIEPYRMATMSRLQD